MKKLLVFIFTIIPLVFFSQAQIGNDIDGEAANDKSGSAYSLSSDGNIVAIGASQNDGVNGQASGHVRVYENINNVWTQIGDDIDGEAASDLFGGSVSLSSNGSIVAIGAIFNDGINGTNSGHVSVYENINNTWIKIGNDIDGEAAGDVFGFEVSLSSNGDIVAIGAPSNDGINGINSGHVRVYENINNTWTQIGNDIDGEDANDFFGRTVSLSSDGSIVAIGAPQNDGINGQDSGHVRIYENVNDTWTQIGSDIDGESAQDESGTRVSLAYNGSIVAIGAIDNNGINGQGSGHVRVYENINSVWTQLGSDIDGEAAQDASGWSLSLSWDGSMVAIGAQNNKGNMDEEFTGHVRIHKNINNVWTQVGSDIDGEAAEDYFGSRGLSFSQDGTILAAGAFNHNGVNGVNSGHVKVYSLSDVLSSEDFVLSQFLLYPNPVSKEFTINIKESLILEKVIIYNQLGQFIKEETKSVIDVSNLSKGLYLVEIITNKGKATKKILIE